MGRSLSEEDLEDVLDVLEVVEVVCWSHTAPGAARLCPGEERTDQRSEQHSNPGVTSHLIIMYTTNISILSSHS